MNKSVCGLLAAALVGVTAAPANADEGSASAAVLRANLEVSLLKGGAAVPLDIELNSVKAPRSADETLLEARVDGAHDGKPFTVMDAEAATSRATVEEGKAEGYSNLTEAKVYLPGTAKRILGTKPLVHVEKVTSEAVCEAGAEPAARSLFVGEVRVLGKKVAVTAGGTTSVRVDGVGTVELKPAETVTTSRTAAATALRLDIAVDPANLGVAGVRGRVTLVEAACETPGGEGGGNGGSTGSTGSTDGGSTEGSGTGGSTDGSTGGSTGGDSGSAGSSGSAGGEENDPQPQTGPQPSGGKPDGSLAETGGSSATPYIAGGALALVAAGGGLLMLRRRRASGTADA
ncbi:SCO1860 family LAETG-anchored protein [Streptomyces sp. CNQ085]|uniref:SCO1860 family LAETG-anchored protein n=1 Tax=Streptomyces sp. CNQ085 TaxID=2886944 RepID=UPI001F50AF7F|nr:SCO1860 family LAETG-anchored protein [Streptomyces sp. CNQ085]MCI0383047.1 LPXTG cell wall anchor domain-containing protein [Streptomyces sp. CNQ085]